MWCIYISYLNDGPTHSSHSGKLGEQSSVTKLPFWLLGLYDYSILLAVLHACQQLEVWLCWNVYFNHALVPFRLLPFRLFITARCHFAYSHFAYSLPLGAFRIFITARCHFAYSHFAYSLPLGVISPTQAKCDQNNLKQLKQAVKVYKVKGIVQKRNKNGKFITLHGVCFLISPRTNYLEGWYNKLKRIARKAHPNVFELVEIFKQEQSEQRSQLTRTRKLEN